MTYDKNGNILSLDRFGQEVSGQPIKIDVLTYTYDGNRLLKVADTTNSPDGFKDGDNTGNDYTYDTMGNMLTDKNKVITNIKYNHLNLPTQVIFETGTIIYTYDATGTKLRKIVEPYNGTAVTTEYLGVFQYEDNDLQFFFQPEGYVKKDENAYLYVFQYKDHLGNIRLSYADCNNDGVIQPSSEILEENNYYPFGLKHQGYNELANSCRSEQAEKYQYNGKEWNDALGLNIYEMDLRQYDPAIGRWTVQDPVIHHEFSPYSAFDNNPVYWADPSGADAVPITVMDLFNATENGSNASFEFSNGRMISANMRLELASFISEQLQAMYEMQPLEGTEYEGSKGNGHGGGNRNGGGSQPKPNEYFIANELAEKFGYTMAEKDQIAKWLIRHPFVVDDGILRFKGIDNIYVNLNTTESNPAVEKMIDKAVKKATGEAIEKILTKAVSKTFAFAVDMTLTGPELKNYQSQKYNFNSAEADYYMRYNTATLNMMNYMFGRNVTIQQPSMLNNMSKIKVNGQSNWEIFYKTY